MSLGMPFIQSENIVDKLDEVIQETMSELRIRCQCSFEDSQITNAGFQCFPSSPNAVTLRAKVSGSEQTTASELVGYLDDWTQEGAFISVQAQLLSADGSCSIVISSFGEQECNLEEATTPSTEATTLNLGDVTSSGVQTITFIGAVVAAVATILLAMIAILIVIVALLVRRNKTTLKMQATSPPPE